VVGDVEMENPSATHVLSPGATAGVIVGLVLLLILGVAIIFAITVCFVRHGNAQNENHSTLWMSTGEGLSFGMARGISNYLIL
jgi:hypothetical protein